MKQADMIKRVNSIKQRVFSLGLGSKEQLDGYCLRKSPMGAWYSIEYRDHGQVDKVPGFHWLINQGGMKSSEFDSWSFGVIQALNFIMDVQGKNLAEVEFKTVIKWN